MRQVADSGHGGIVFGGREHDRASSKQLPEGEHLFEGFGRRGVGRSHDHGSIKKQVGVGCRHSRTLATRHGVAADKAISSSRIAGERLDNLSLGAAGIGDPASFRGGLEDLADVQGNLIDGGCYDHSIGVGNRLNRVAFGSIDRSALQSLIKSLLRPTDADDFEFVQATKSQADRATDQPNAVDRDLFP